MHHGGVNRWPVTPSPDPGKALFVGDPLWNRERPVDGIQFGMTIYTTIVPYIRPRKETRVGSYVPFLFLLQELEWRWSLLLDRGRPDAALPGRNAAICLHLDRIGAVICRQSPCPWRGSVILVGAAWKARSSGPLRVVGRARGGGPVYSGVRSVRRGCSLLALGTSVVGLGRGHIGSGRCSCRG